MRTQKIKYLKSQLLKQSSYSHDDVPKLWGGGMSRKFDDFVIVVVGFPHDYEFYKSKAMMFTLIIN